MRSTVTSPCIHTNSNREAEMSVFTRKLWLDQAEQPEPQPEKEMDTFAAAMIADGEFDLAGFEATQDNYLAAYQHLVNTGAAWSLQGRIGREAHRLIESGLIQPAS